MKNYTNTVFCCFLLSLGCAEDTKDSSTATDTTSRCDEILADDFEPKFQRWIKTDDSDAECPQIDGSAMSNGSDDSIQTCSQPIIMMDSATECIFTQACSIVDSDGIEISIGGTFNADMTKITGVYELEVAGVFCRYAVSN